MSLFEWLGLRKPSVIGVDISSSCVKLIQLSEQNGHWHIEGYSLEPLEDTAQQDSESFSAELVTKAIKRALEKYPFTAKHAAIAIPSTSAISKVIQMPAFLKKSEFPNQVILEASKHIPYSIDEVDMDYQILGPNESVEQELDVLLVAARTDLVRSRVKAVQAANLEVEYVDVETYVLERAVGQMPSMKDEQKCIAVVDIGATSTNICIIHAGKSVYAREQEFGGRQLTEAIMQHYDMTFAQAGKAKRENNLPEDYKEVVFEPFLQTLIQEISRGLEFFYSSSEYSSIDKILIGGATIQENYFIEKLSKHFNVPVDMANPLEGMRVNNPDLQTALKNDCAALLICCGLAMRGVHG